MSEQYKVPKVEVFHSSEKKKMRPVRFERERHLKIVPESRTVLAQRRLREAITRWAYKKRLGS
jgi:hypothetical protein